jgi:signal transduction histidine kinase
MPPTPAELVVRLRTFPQLDDVPDEELLWLATEGRCERYEVDELVVAAGGDTVGLFFVLAGRLAFYVGEREQRRKPIEWRAGEFTGILPFSRLVAPPGDTVAAEPVEMIVLPKERFPDMVRSCYRLTALTVHVMLDRARLFNSVALHNEKMISLGKLAAGLAHELNNPASAIARSADDLDARLSDADGGARALGAAGLDADQIALLERVRDRCLDADPTAIRSPIEQADREDALIDWLDDRGVDADLALPLAETSIVLDDLDGLATLLDGAQLAIGLTWIARSCGVRTLAAEIGEAAERIHTLVGSVKGFTHMDRARIARPIDVAHGISSTLTMLEGRARDRGAAVVLDLPPDLPRVRGFGGELNQVWMNLIDNALDAIDSGGRVEVAAVHEGERVVVTVRDDGPGIPDEVRSKIFDPFYTTKGVGEGTGLGLDIVRRLVDGHGGTGELETGPGGTAFRVGLPLAETEGA